MKEIHIIPLNDLEYHEPRLSCHCSPRIEYPNDDVAIIVHYAFDKRNVVEDLVEELSIELNYGNWGIYTEEE